MKSIFNRLLLTVAFCVVPISAIPASGEPTLKPKANDLWVMAGDSITAQRLHTNYIEAFFRTRYPDLNLQFRNSGIGGNRTGNILQRFDLIATLQGKLNNDWRAASKAKNQEGLAAAQTAIDECEHELQTACKPAALHFEIELAR